MSKFKEIIERHTFKQDRRVKNICSPLHQIGIDSFGYFRIERDGSFGILSNRPMEVDFYFEEKFHLHHPYFIHPDLVRPGQVLVTIAYSKDDSERIFKFIQIYHVFLIINHNVNNLEGYLFSKKGVGAEITLDFYSKLDLLHSFISYFKRETHVIVEAMMGEKFSLKQEKGEDFLKVNPTLPLANTNPEIQKFLQLVMPLSLREQECLKLFKQGKSAQATGAILGLSQRTVEHYIDNIKNKLNCHSKWELLEW